MRKSINLKMLAIVLAFVCLLTFSVSVIAYNKDNFNTDRATNNVAVNNLNGGGRNSDPIGTAITTAAELRSWLEGSELNGYLVNDINDWTKLYSNTELNLAEGRTLDGNGKTITARTDDNVIVQGKDEVVHGYLVDNNNGTIRNLTIKTANNAGKIEFDSQDDEPFGSSGFQKWENGRILLGVVAGVNRGIIDNCTVDVNHAIQNTWKNSGSPIRWSYPALGAVTGANYTTSVSKGVISNTTVNMNNGGGLVLGVWGSAKSSVIGKGETARGRVAAIAGIGNTTDSNVVSFANNVVNYNGGVIGIVACKAAAEVKETLAATVTSTVSVGNSYEGGSNNETPVVDGLIINGTPNFKDLWNHGNRQWAYTVHSSDGSRERNMYITENMGTGVMADKAHSAKFYNLPTDSSAKYVDGRVQLTKANSNTNQIIFSIHGVDVWEQQLSQLDTANKIITFDANSAGAANTALDAVAGTVDNVASLGYGAESIEYDGQYHAAQFYNSQGSAISSEVVLTYSNNNTDADEHTATYTPSGNNVVGIDDGTKILYLGNEELTAKLTINQRVVGVVKNIGNVYNSNITFSNLLEGHTVWVNNTEVANVEYVLDSAIEYTITVNNSNYKFADAEETTFIVSAKEFNINSRITLAEATDGATIEDGKLILTKKLDSVKLTATSSKYGTKITEITGAVNNNATATNSTYTADIALTNDVTELGITEVNRTVTMTAESNNAEYGSVLVDKANPTIGESVVYTATALEGYIFLGWTEDGKYVSFDAIYNTIAGTQDKALVAVFADKCNVVIMNGDREVGKLSLTTEQLANLVLGETISAEEANLGDAAINAVDKQAYNDFYGWRVDSISEDGVYTLKAIYADAVEKVEVSIDGVVKNYAINSDIVLTQGNYTVNGVAITVDNVTTLKALAGLTIVTNGEATAEASATGVYDADSKVGGVLQINAVVAEDAEITVEITNTTTNDSVIANAIKGRLVANISGGNKIIQAIVKINQDFLDFAEGRIEAKIYVGTELIGTIVVREA